MEHTATDTLALAHVRTLLAPYLSAALGVTGIEIMNPINGSSPTTPVGPSSGGISAAEQAASIASSPLFSRLSGGANLLFLIRTAGTSALVADSSSVSVRVTQESLVHGDPPGPLYSSAELEVADRLLIIALAAMDVSAPHGSTFGSNLTHIQKSATSSETNALIVHKGAATVASSQWGPNPAKSVPYNKHALVATALYHPSFASLLRRVHAVMPNAVRALARQLMATLLTIALPVAVTGHMRQQAPWTSRHSSAGAPSHPFLTPSAPGYVELAGSALFQMVMDISIQLSIWERAPLPRAVAYTQERPDGKMSSFVQQLSVTTTSASAPTLHTPYLKSPFSRDAATVILGAPRSLIGGGPVPDEMLRSRLDSVIAPLLQLLAIAASLPVPDATARVVSQLMCGQELRKAVHCGPRYQHRVDTEATSPAVLLGTTHHIELLEAFASSMIVSDSLCDEDRETSSTLVDSSALMSVLRDVLLFSAVASPLVTSRKVDLCRGVSRFGYGGIVSSGGGATDGNGVATLGGSSTTRRFPVTSGSAPAAPQPPLTTSTLSSSDPFVANKSDTTTMPAGTSPLASAACAIPMSFVEQYNVHTAMLTVLFALEETLKVPVLEVGRYGFSPKEAASLRKEASENGLTSLAFLEIRGAGNLGVGVGGRLTMGAAASPSLAPPSSTSVYADLADAPQYLSDLGQQEGSPYHAPPPLADDRSEIEDSDSTSSISGAASEVADGDQSTLEEGVEEVVGRSTSMMPEESTPAVPPHPAVGGGVMVVGDSRTQPSSVLPSQNASPSPHRNPGSFPPSVTTATGPRVVHFDPASVARSPSALRDEALQHALRSSEMYPSMVFPSKTPPSAASVHAAICMSAILLTCSRTNIEHAIPTHQGSGSVRRKLEELRSLRKVAMAGQTSDTQAAGEVAEQMIPVEAAEEYSRVVGVAASPSMSAVYPIPLGATTVSSTAQLSPATVVTLVQWLFQSYSSSPLPLTAAALLHMIVRHYTVCTDITIGVMSVYGKNGLPGAPSAGTGWNEGEPTVTPGRDAPPPASVNPTSTFTLCDAVLVATNRAIQLSVGSTQDGNLRSEVSSSSDDDAVGEGCRGGVTMSSLAENVVPHGAWPLYAQLCLVCVRMNCDRNRFTSETSGPSSPTNSKPKGTSSSSRRVKGELPAHPCGEAQRALLQLLTTVSRFYIADSLPPGSAAVGDASLRRKAISILASSCSTSRTRSEQEVINAYRHRTPYSSATRVLLRAVEECLQDHTVGCAPEVLRWGLVLAWRSADGHVASVAADNSRPFDPSRSFALDTPASQRLNLFELIEEADGDECINADLSETIYAAIAASEGDVAQWQDTKELRWLQRREGGGGEALPVSRRSVGPVLGADGVSAQSAVFDRSAKRHYALSLAQASLRGGVSLFGNIPCRDDRVLVGVRPARNLHSYLLSDGAQAIQPASTGGRAKSVSSPLSPTVSEYGLSPSSVAPPSPAGGQCSLAPQQVIWVLAAAYVYLQRQWWVATTGQGRRTYHEGAHIEKGSQMKHYGLVLPSAL